MIATPDAFGRPPASASNSPEPHHTGGENDPAGWPPPQRWATLAAVAAMLAGGMTHLRAADSAEPRYYLGLRFADTNPATGVHDAWGISAGMNLNRYFGLEFAADAFDLFLEPGNLGTIGEYGVWTLVPEARFRFPLLHDRLVPYALLGGGVALTQFNDRKPPAFGKDVDWETSTPIGVIGGGLEYYIADNLALGFEIKYLFGGNQTLKVDNISYDMSVDSWLMMLSLRVYFPEHTDGGGFSNPPDAATRLYFGVNVGGALPVNDEIFPGIQRTAAPFAYFDSVDHLYGFSLGVDFGRHLGAEIWGSWYEPVLNTPQLGGIGEYAVYSVIPRLRYRFPSANNRFVPYLVGGAGFGHSEFNDRKPPGNNLEITEEKTGWAASFGGGLEYFFASNFAVNFEASYLFSRGQTIQIDNGPKLDGNLDAVLFSVGLRIYLANFTK